MAKLNKKKRKIIKNKVIGSIQVTMGILILLVSIFGFIINFSYTAQLKESSNFEINSIIRDTASLKNGSLSNNSNYSKDTLFLMTLTRTNRFFDSENQRVKNFLEFNFLLAITSLLSLLFITQGIVNFGLNKEQNGK